MRTRVLLILFLGSYSALSCAQDAAEIIRKSEEKFRGTSSAFTEMTITIQRPRWTREMSMKLWMKTQDYSMVLITAPAKEKGSAFLKRKNEVWSYMPTIERTMKMPPSMMSQSWMGTDFTNDDLVKESSMTDDYDQKIVGDSTIRGLPCYKIELKPKAEAAVVWGKIILFIDKKDFVQMRMEKYDEDGYLVNTLNAYDIEKMGGRVIATRSELIPADKKGQKTIMKVISISFDQPMDANFFTLQNMKRVK